jgi:hypothetical protein
VEVFAALVTEPAGEAPYMVNDETQGLLQLCLLPLKFGGEVFEGECKDNDLRFGHFISKMGGDSDVSLLGPDPRLIDSSLVEDTSDLSSFKWNGRGGRRGDSVEEIDPTGILIECAGLLRPLAAPVIAREEREGLAMKGPAFLGLSLKDEKLLGAALPLKLSLTLSVGGLCQDPLDSSMLPMLTIGGAVHDRCESS